MFLCCNVQLIKVFSERGEVYFQPFVLRGRIEINVIAELICDPRG